MNTQIIQNAANQNSGYPNCARTEKMQDILLVSSFGLWAVLLGLSPVLAYHALMT